MVPEATIICVDNSTWFCSESSLNMVHQAEAFELYCHAKIQSNPKNTVGAYALCERKPGMLLVPTSDLGKIQTGTRRIEGLKPGGLIEFDDGLHMATMGFICGDNEKLKRRFIVFSGGRVITYDETRLQGLENSLKMNNIALDFVMMGPHINERRLKAFVAAVNNNDNSHIVRVASPSSICQAILSPPLFPRFGEGVRRLAAPGSISMLEEKATQKKKADTYFDENVEPQEMNKKDNQKPENNKSVRASCNIRLKVQLNASTQEIVNLKLDIEKIMDPKAQIDALRRENKKLKLELDSVKGIIKWPAKVNLDEWTACQLFVLLLKCICWLIFDVSPWLLCVVYVFLQRAELLKLVGIV